MERIRGAAKSVFANWILWLPIVPLIDYRTGILDSDWRWVNNAILVVERYQPKKRRARVQQNRLANATSAIAWRPIFMPAVCIGMVLPSGDVSVARAVSGSGYCLVSRSSFLHNPDTNSSSSFDGAAGRLLDCRPEAVLAWKREPVETVLINYPVR